MNRYVLALILVLALSGVAAGRTDEHRSIRRAQAVPTATATPTVAPQATESAAPQSHAGAIPTCGVPVKMGEPPTSLCTFHATNTLFP